MDLTEMLAEDSASAISTVAMIVMGDSGTGKSRLGALMPEPIIALMEKNGEATILQWNPKALVWKLYQDDRIGTYTGTPYAPITDPDKKLLKLQHMLETIMASQSNPNGPGRIIPSPVLGANREDIVDYDWSKTIVRQSFVLDTVTEFQQVQLEAMLGTKAFDITGDDDISGKTWQALNRRTKDLHRVMRDMPLHALSLGHVAEKDTGRGVKAQLAFYGGKVAPDVPKYVNAVGWLQKREIEGKIGYFVVFQGASDVCITKWCSGLQAIEPVPVSPSDGGPELWIANILEADPGTKMGLAEAHFTSEEAMTHVRNAVGRRSGVPSGRAALLGGSTEQPAVVSPAPESSTPPVGRKKRGAGRPGL